MISTIHSSRLLESAKRDRKTGENKEVRDHLGIQVYEGSRQCGPISVILHNNEKEHRVVKEDNTPFVELCPIQFFQGVCRAQWKTNYE